MGLDATSLAAMNSRKAALHRELWPAVVTFLKTGATEYTVAFGEKDNEGELHESGQVIQNHRIGVLYFPVLPAFTPSTSQVFKVKTASQAITAGKSYRIDRVVSAPGEPVLKAYCARVES